MSNYINELRPDLLASGAVQPWPGNISSSREQMLGGHLSQALVIKGATTRRCLTGVEREFGRFTFNVKMPCDAEILRVVRKVGPSIRSARNRTLHTIIYMDVVTREVGVLDLPVYHCKHQHFGFEYKLKAAANRLVPGATIAKGTVLADSPAVDDLGNYRMGIETNVAFMSLPGIIEDGVIVSEEYVEKLVTKGYDSRVASWGENFYPLNIYGDENTYKPFPDIGEPIREDGLLFAMRSYDDLLGPVEMSPRALMEVDHTFDRCVWIPDKNARVVDINVWHDSRNNVSYTPAKMETQTLHYYQSTSSYYQDLLDEYQNLKRKYKEQLRITPQFHRLLVEALSYRPDHSKNKVPQQYQRQPLDDWRVEIVYEVDIKPTVGFKLTGFHGDKGVICAVWPTEDMPVDQEGNRADCIMDSDSTIKRMNLSRLYEQRINATSRHVTNKVREMAKDRSQAGYQQAWKYLLRYYEICSPKMHALLSGPSYTQNPEVHVEAVVKDGVYLWMPTDNPTPAPQIIRDLHKEYPIHRGPVTFRGRSGNVVTTVNNVLIGSIYVMLLEKTSTYDWSGVASAKLQPFGIPARLTRFDKNAMPGRPQPVRITGESEVRLLAATIGGDATADLLDMSNNPVTHQHVYTNILRAERPSDIASVVDRNVVPVGNGRNLLYVHHALECAGVEFYPTDDTDDRTIYTESEEEV